MNPENTTARSDADALRVAAAAPADLDAIEDPKDIAAAAEIDELFERWSYWCATRRYFAPPASMGSILGQLTAKSRPQSRPGGPDAACSTTMAALHLAIIGQPPDALDTKVFWAYYGARAVHIKQAAAVLGISRQHFYRLLRSFGQRVIATAKTLEDNNVRAREALPNHEP